MNFDLLNLIFTSHDSHSLFGFEYVNCASIGDITPQGMPVYLCLYLVGLNFISLSQHPEVFREILASPFRS